MTLNDLQPLYFQGIERDFEAFWLDYC